jgi:hypothetical protein
MQQVQTRRDTPICHKTNREFGRDAHNTPSHWPMNYDMTVMESAWPGSARSHCGDTMRRRKLTVSSYH